MRRLLRTALRAGGYKVLEAASGQEGLLQAETRLPEPILLDLNLPDLDGLEVTRRVRAWTQTPIIVLSARGQESDKLAAFDAGVDDYLIKPFGVRELLARMRLALRHAARTTLEPDEPVFTVGRLRVDLGRRRVSVAEQSIHLTPIEYRLLATLIRYAGKVVPHCQLLHEVWGEHTTHDSHFLSVYMGHLRQKLEVEPARPRYLITEVGVGYRLKTN